MLKPDAFAVIERAGFEDHFFIELDRATESLPRIVDKARNYVRYWQSGREQARYGVFPLVLWSTPTEHRSAQLIDAIGQVGAEHWRMFAVATHERTVELICADQAALGRRT